MSKLRIRAGRDISFIPSSPHGHTQAGHGSTWTSEHVHSNSCKHKCPADTVPGSFTNSLAVLQLFLKENITGKLLENTFFFKEWVDGLSDHVSPPQPRCSSRHVNYKIFGAASPFSTSGKHDAPDLIPGFAEDRTTFTNNLLLGEDVLKHYR